MDAKKTVTYTIDLTPGMMMLFIIFLVLKLTNVISWSWWWVTAPLWVFPVFIVACLIFAAVIAILVGIALLVKGVFK